MSRSTIDDWLKLRERTGSVGANTTYRCGKAASVSDEEWRAFAREHEGCTLAQMALAWQQQSGQVRSQKFFSRGLERIGWTRKKRVFCSASATHRNAASL